MARRIVVECDACMALEEPDGEPASTHEISLPGIGPVTLDLCEPHRKIYLEDLTTLAGDYGLRGGKADLQQPPKPGAMRLGRPPAGGVRPHSCLLCTADYASQSGLQLHYHKVHGMDGSLSEIYGPRCALCGETSNRNHASTVHGEPITQVMRDAERKGDPFGVVRTLRARARG
jgi:hypothetical protein